MSACVSLTKMANSLVYKCPVIEEVILGPALTAVPNNTFQESGIVSVVIPENITSVGQYAFYNCKSLKTVTMHDGVTSIGSKIFQYSTIEEFTVPMGVTNIPQDCFHGCTSLTTSPVLPATELAERCYNQMFLGCTSLNYIKCLATDISAIDCTSSWVSEVSSTGTFVKHPDMSDWTTGINGIPIGWDVVDAEL
jgi:hypothetical protein